MASDVGVLTSELGTFALLKRLFLLASRLLLRQRVRTLVTLATLVFSQVILVLTFGITRGSEWMVIRQVCEKSTGHVQIQHPEFARSLRVRAYLAETPDAKVLREWVPGIRRVLDRTFAHGFLEFDGETQLVAVRGRDPGDDFIPPIVDGGPLLDDPEEFAPYPALIGKELAASLGLVVGDLMMWNFMNLEGRIDDIQVEVWGITDESSPEHDRHNMVIHVDAVRDILELGSGSHVVALVLDDARTSEEVAEVLQTRLGEGYAVLPWTRFNPQLRRVLRIISSQMKVVVFLVVLVSLFGIASTLGMSVSDRVRELGLLKTLGVGPRRLGAYVLCEGLLLGMVTALLGGVLAVVALGFFGLTGIDLTPLAGEAIIVDGVRIDMKLRPIPEAMDFVRSTLLVIGTAFVASLFPAWRASRLSPARALRIME